MTACGSRRREDFHFFNIDEDLVYEPFTADFGPLNLGMTYRYCTLLDSKLRNEALAGKRLVHCCSSTPQLRANAAYLVCAYQVVVLRTSPKQAWAPFAGVEPRLLPFRDASSRPCSFELTVLDCLEGLAKAMALGWFNLASFDINEYETLLSVDCIDASWVMPNKFLAFSGPIDETEDQHGFQMPTPDDCVPIFKKAGVTLVVRLNRRQYDRQRFIDQGLKHLELYFPDGSCPKDEIISKFLWVAENEPGAIAVHCKAGLGRTGTLIGLYAMKHYHFPARALIGWLRICRPGSILGPQQQFMCDKQDEMFRALPHARPPAPVQLPRSLASDAPPQRPPAWRHNCSAPAAGQRPVPQPPLPVVVSSALPPAEPCAVQGDFVDVGQGERLCEARRFQRLAAGPPAREPLASKIPAVVTKAITTVAASSQFGGAFLLGTGLPSSVPLVPSLKQADRPQIPSLSGIFGGKVSNPPSPTHGTPQQLIWRVARPCVMQPYHGAPAAPSVSKPLGGCWEAACLRT